VVPDQAPVAAGSATPGNPGRATSFTAAASTVAYGTITSYRGDFGDGTQATTSTDTTSHVYATAGTCTATVAETDSAGTSTALVFIGQTVSNNGGPSATGTTTVVVGSSTTTMTTSPPPARRTGFRDVAADGGVLAFGADLFYGSIRASPPGWSARSRTS
jgi:PKD repeat protein